jgi:hypothetical protein
VSVVHSHEREKAFDDIWGEAQHQRQFENVLKWGLPGRLIFAGFFVSLDFAVLNGGVCLLAPTNDTVGEARRLCGVYPTAAKSPSRRPLGAVLRSTRAPSEIKVTSIVDRDSRTVKAPCGGRLFSGPTRSW